MTLSKFEQRTLDAARKADRKAISQPSRLAYTLYKHYTPDIELSNGIIVECKGFFSPEDRAKMLAVKEGHPLLDIRFVFQIATKKFSKAPKSLTYWQWAVRHGFPWADGRIPESWYTEPERPVKLKAKRGTKK